MKSTFTDWGFNTRMIKWPMYKGGQILEEVNLGDLTIESNA